MNDSSTENSCPTGLFVSGYRWSGSGAVIDWLSGCPGLSVAPEDLAPLGEIRALTYGIRDLFAVATGGIRLGERIARAALCPDKAVARTTLGAGEAGPVMHALDTVYTIAVANRLRPPITMYKHYLDAQLGSDFRYDQEYLRAVSRFADALRGARHSDNPCSHSALRWAISNLLCLMGTRVAPAGSTHVFDNALPAARPEMFELIDPTVFPVRVVILVARDPRDQFVELVEHSNSTFSWSYTSFIQRYREARRRTDAFLARRKQQPGPGREMYRCVSFEDFVLNVRSIQDDLQTQITTLLNPSGTDGAAMPQHWISDRFNPEESARNIGIWKRSALKRQIRAIEYSLPEYLYQEPCASS